MEVRFKTNKLQKQYENSKDATKAYNEDVAKKYVQRVNILKIAKSFDDLYKIPQPTSVDLSYEIRIFTGKMKDLNKFNEKIQKTFGIASKQKEIKNTLIPKNKGISIHCITPVGNNYLLSTSAMCSMSISSLLE